MSKLRFFSFATLAWIITPFYAVALLVSWPLNEKYPFLVARNWCRVVLCLARVICGLRYRVEGIENFPDDTCIAFLKHSSTFETFAQLIFLPRHCWVLKKELGYIPFFGWCLKPLKAIPIDRSAGRKAVATVIEEGTERLENGINISIFPEGTRMPAGKTKRYGKSGVLLAQASGHPIVPIAHNAGYFWTKTSWAIKPGEVVFVVGKPVDAFGRDVEAVNQELQDWIEAEVAKLAPAESQ